MFPCFLRNALFLAVAVMIGAPSVSFADDNGRGPGRGNGHQGDDRGPQGHRQDHDRGADRGDRDTQDADGGVVVCHVTGSDSNAVVVLVLPESAARAHERHGDVLLDNDHGDVSQRCQDAVDAVQGIERPSRGQCVGQGNLPQMPTAVATQSGRVILSWQVDPFAVSYRIYQGAPPGMNLTLVQVIPAGGMAGASVAGLVPGQAYSFEVRAVRPNGMEQATVASVQGGAPILASASLCVSVEATTATTATLAWRAVRRADSYVVLQSAGAGRPFVPADVASFSSDEATVVGLVPGRAYFFQVVALDAAGQAIAPSNVIVVTTPVV